MGDLKKWHVVDPNGFVAEITAKHEDTTLYAAFHWPGNTIQRVARQAGYRAEPIEEPKMVTVRADALADLYDSYAEHRRAKVESIQEIYAALDSAS